MQTPKSLECHAYSSGRNGLVPCLQQRTNDNFKGSTTSWGSGALSYRSALILSNAATLAGGIASVIFADGLIKQFSGRGLVEDALAASSEFRFAVAAGPA